MMKIFLIIGAINALLAVGLGAFGAHGLEGKIPDKYFAIWQKAVTYQMFHTMGLFVIAFIADKLQQSGLIMYAGWAMLLGIILFSGSLYILSVTQIKILGAITPLGGIAFLTAWVLLITSVVKYM